MLHIAMCNCRFETDISRHVVSDFAEAASPNHERRPKTRLISWTGIFWSFWCMSHFWICLFWKSWFEKRDVPRSKEAIARLEKCHVLVSLWRLLSEWLADAIVFGVESFDSVWCIKLLLKEEWNLLWFKKAWGKCVEEIDDLKDVVNVSGTWTEARVKKALVIFSASQL